METLGTVSLFILYCIKTIALNSAIKKVGPAPLFLLNQTEIFCNNFSVTAQKQARQEQHLNGHLDGHQHQRLVSSVALVLCHHQTPLATRHIEPRSGDLRPYLLWRSTPSTHWAPVQFAAAYGASGKRDDFLPFLVLWQIHYGERRMKGNTSQAVRENTQPLFIFWLVLTKPVKSMTAAVSGDDSKLYVVVRPTTTLIVAQLFLCLSHPERGLRSATCARFFCSVATPCPSQWDPEAQPCIPVQSHNTNYYPQH